MTSINETIKDHSLYEITGKIEDINTMLINRGDLTELYKKTRHIQPFGSVTVKRLSQKHENHRDMYAFYPVGEHAYLDNVDEHHAVYTLSQADVSPIKKMEGFIIHGSSGSTSFKSQNFISGIFETLQSAIKQAEDDVSSRKVSSEYSRTGIYDVFSVSYEILGDQRMILGDRVYEDSYYFFIHGEDVDSLNHRGKHMARLGKYDHE